MIVNVWMEFWLFLISMVFVIVIHELGHLFVMVSFDNKARIVFDKKKKAIYTKAKVNDTVYILSLYSGIAFGAFAVIGLAIFSLWSGYILYPTFVVVGYFVGILDDIKEIKGAK